MTEIGIEKRPERGPSPRPGGVESSSSRVEIGLTAFLWFLALVLGFAQAWKMRFAIDHDAVSYLDMGDAYFRRDWKVALNGYFNPFYAWLLGLANKVSHPGPEWEYPLVHLVQYLIFVFCLWCFSFFFKELLFLRENSFAAGKTATEEPWSRVFWIVLGYTVFIWSSLSLVAVSGTNPDMLIAALVYLATATIIRIQRGRGTLPVFIGLGAALGIGYLTKAIFLPLGFVFLGAGLWVSRKQKETTRGFLVAAVVFAFLAGPFILALSLAKGRFTTSDTGRLNYAWYVDGIRVRHWQGEPPEAGRPRHPTRLLVASPETFEFATPVGGTYPVWYDVSYWYEGLRVPFSLRRQVSAFKANLVKLAVYVLELKGALVIGGALLLLTAGRLGEATRRLRFLGGILVPSIGALGAYALVTVERRYVGAFVTIIALGVFGALHVDGTRLSRLVFAGFAVATFVLFLSHVGSILRLGTVGRNEPAEMAEGLTNLGIGPGSWVAGVDYSKGENLAWARLARVRIVCEVFYSPTTIALRENNFWRASQTTQNQILSAFAKAGAKAVVSDEPPPPDQNSSATWKRVGNTHFYVRLLSDLAHRGPLPCEESLAARIAPCGSSVGPEALAMKDDF